MSGRGEPLWVVGVGDVDTATLETVADGAAETVPVDARVDQTTVDASGFDGDGEPYHGLDFARYAREQSGRDTVLAVTDADIEKPRGDPAFGLAIRNGSYGIVSTARLGDPDAAPVADRLRTLASQHVGYLVGMGACSDDHCLFYVPDSAAEFDRIGPGPCPGCRDTLSERDSPLLSSSGGGSVRTGASKGERSDRGAGAGRGTDDGGSRITEPRATLTVVGVGDVDGEIVTEAAAAVESQLPFVARTAPGSVPLSFVPDDAYDEERAQYRASAVARAAREFVDDAPCLAVTDVDLFEERRNYVFGVGEREGEAAGFSTYRLRDDASQVRARERGRKQAIKQSGRLLGVGYCDDSDCVFTSAPTVRELDDTGETPCDDCRRTLDESDWSPGYPAPDSEASESIGSGDDGRDDQSTGGSEPQEGPPGEQGTIEWLWSSLLHDLANTGRFVGAIAGFALSFFAAILLLVPVTEFFLGPWDQQSNQVGWVVIVLALVLAWYLYRKLKRLVGLLTSKATSGVRSVAE